MSFREPEIINQYSGALPDWWGEEVKHLRTSVTRHKGARISPSDIHEWPRQVRSLVSDSDGEEVPETVFLRRGRVSYPPAHDDGTAPTVLGGRSVYLGWLIGHYGHFLTESLSRAWYLFESEPFDNYLFHSNFRSKADLPCHVVAMLELLGIPIERVVLARSALAAEELYCPSQAFRCDHGYAEQHGRIFHESVRAVGADSGRNRVFLSRAGLPGNARRFNEEECWKVFEHHGFIRVIPESLSIVQQIRLYAGASVIAGPVGSAMHNAAFMRDGHALVLAPSSFMFMNDFLLSRAREYKLDYFIADRGTSRVSHTSWSCDVGLLEECVSRWVGTVEAS